MDKIGEKIGVIAVFFTMISISSSPYPITLVISYVIHELGHLVLAKINNIPMKKFKVGSFRISLSYDCSNVSYKKEMALCFGGIFFNFIAVLIAWISGLSGSEVGGFFVLCNISLAAVNLYPVSVLDGGGILRCALMMIFDSCKAQKASKIISFVAVFFLWLCAVYLQLVFDANISMLFISIFLLIELCFSA